MSILKHYLNAQEFSPETLLLDEVDISPDYSIYLVKNGGRFYAVAQADYFFMDEVAHNVQENFPVQVEGWLRKHRSKNEAIVRVDLFESASPVNGSNEEWEEYRQITYQEDGWKFVVLKVRLNSDVTTEDILET